MKVPGRCFFTFVLPIVGVTISAIHFRYPGDEFGLWGAGSLSGLWILWPRSLIASGGSPGDILPLVLVAGFGTMTALGYFLDRLHCPRMPFVITWFTVATLVTAGVLSQFPSYERAMAKNGSLYAYVFFGANISLLLVALLFLIVTPLLNFFGRYGTTKSPPEA